MIYDKSHYKELLKEKVVLDAFILSVLVGSIIGLDYAFNDASTNGVLLLVVIAVIILGFLIIWLKHWKLIYDIKSNEAQRIDTYISDKTVTKVYNAFQSGYIYEYCIQFDEGGELVVSEGFYNGMELNDSLTLVLTQKLNHLIVIESSGNTWSPKEIFHVEME